MNSRLKIFGIIIVLGFVAGIIAQVTAVFVIPWMIAVLPLLGGVTSFLDFRIGRCVYNSCDSRRLDIYDQEKRTLLNKSILSASFFIKIYRL